MVKKLLNQFVEQEAFSSVVLFMVAVLAIIWANSNYRDTYFDFANQYHFIVNDGLMTIFFLLIGLELKKGRATGKMSQIVLPAVGALGGMLLPAFIYLFFNFHHPETIKGWSIPVATDIAFALGTLSLFGRYVPQALKLFLMALALFDDIGAILIISLFLSHDLSIMWLSFAACMFLFLLILNRLLIQMLFPYLIIGVVLWFSVLKSGIHPTISGVLLALTIPHKPHSYFSPLLKLERELNAWVAFFIMPVFALVNAGFSLHSLSFNIFFSPVVVGITLGLFVGKQLGVFGFCWILIKAKLEKLPDQANWLAFYGVALLCGIGFTMSLFLGTLSFQQDTYLTEVKLGVITGSILSGLFGLLVLYFALIRNRRSVVD